MKKPNKSAAPQQAVSSPLAALRVNVAGIDIGSREMYVCGPAREDGRHEIRVFATTTGQIQACVRWLKQEKVESVALESTGVY